jgi:hypothetical protein
MTWRTKISIEACKARLSSGVDVEKIGFSWSGYAGSKPIIGKFWNNHFRLQHRRYYRNSFAPFFYGHFLVSDGGTLVEGEFRMHVFARVFMIVWFSFLGLFSVIALVNSITGHRPARDTLVLSLVVPAGMAAFGIGMVKFSQWLARGEKQAIIVFLENTLEASDIA